MAPRTYPQKILEWRRERDDNIRRENGWLALAGLFWLKQGTNQMGSDPKCEIRLPDRLPAKVGFLEYNGRTVSLHAPPGKKITVNNKDLENVDLQPDISETPSFITLQDVRLVVIQRGNKVGIRMWDNRRRERKNHPERTWYPIDETFRIPATYSAYENPKLTLFPDLTGDTSEFPVEGYLTFEFNAKKYKLDTNKENDGSLFVRFWDPTAKSETYPTGRYVIADQEPGGRIILDFNKAYNPPCAFTQFATCVFSPEQNHLDFKITAGETYERRKP